MAQYLNNKQWGSKFKREYIKNSETKVRISPSKHGIWT